MLCRHTLPIHSHHLPTSQNLRSSMSIVHADTSRFNLKTQLHNRYSPPAIAMRARNPRNMRDINRRLARSLTQCVSIASRGLGLLLASEPPDVALDDVAGLGRKRVLGRRVDMGLIGMLVLGCVWVVCGEGDLGIRVLGWAVLGILAKGWRRRMRGGGGVEGWWCLLELVVVVGVVVGMWRREERLLVENFRSWVLVLEKALKKRRWGF